MKTKPIYAFIAIFLFACKEEDDNQLITPTIPNEEEVITTVKYTLTPVMGGIAKVFQFKDLDGDGGNAPVITTDSIDANVTYSGTLQTSWAETTW